VFERQPKDEVRLKPDPETVVDVTDATFADEVLASPIPVIVDFWAPWCKPCEAIEPHLVGIAAESDGRLRLARMNVDENLGVPSRYGVLSLPTVALFTGGVARVTIHGAHGRSHYNRAFAPYLD
jgi:thioredoxin 1